MPSPLPSGISIKILRKRREHKRHWGKEGKIVSSRFAGHTPEVLPIIHYLVEVEGETLWVEPEEFKVLDWS